MANHTNEAFYLDGLEAAPLTVNGDDILKQISPEMRGEISKVQRPSDVRLILRTAPTGETYSFPNHGHADNEMSAVTFDGQNAIMIMPAGDTARRQLFSAFQIAARMEAAGLKDGVTPQFMEKEIVNPKGLSRRFAAQAYGPAPFDAQAARLVDVDIPGAAGGVETIRPVVTKACAVGMRDPVREEAFLVLHAGKAASLFVKGGDVAAAALTKMENAIPDRLKGTSTTLEAFDGMNILAKGIVLAVDAATGGTKPIRLGTAKDIFNLPDLNWVFVDDQGKVVDQRLKIHGYAPKPA